MTSSWIKAYQRLGTKRENVRWTFGFYLIGYHSMLSVWIKHSKGIDSVWLMYEQLCQIALLLRAKARVPACHWQSSS